jgi:hypothetical protein
MILSLLIATKMSQQLLHLHFQMSVAIIFNVREVAVIEAVIAGILAKEAVAADLIVPSQVQMLFDDHDLLFAELLSAHYY